MPKGNMVALNTPLRRHRKSTACVFYCDKTTLIMWVTGFADVADLITGVSVEEFHAFDDAGRKRIAWGVRGMKCNMTIGKTVGEMYTNYTVQSVELAGYLP